MDSNQTDQITLDFDNGLTIDLTDLNNNYSASGVYTWDSTLTNTMSSSISISPNGYSNISPSWTFSDLSITSPPSGKLTLNGDDADIEINGESVVGMLRDIRDRLNILQVSKEMEKEWDELRILREQYEAKLAECREKSKMWDTLKKMPPVEL
jgi:hypothetical protein